MRVSLFVGCCAAWSLAATCGAAPLLSAGEAQVDGTVLFPDTAERGVFYYLSPGLRLGERYGKPEFVFYKSVGLSSSTAGQEGEALTVGGVIAFTLRRPNPSESMVEGWRRLKGDRARFRPLPLVEVSCRLLLMDPADPNDEGQAMARRSAPWSERSLALALPSEQASLLWSELEAPGNIGLVADIELIAQGYELRDGEAGEPGYERSERRDRFSVALPVSRQEFPELFFVVHNAEQSAFAYRELTVLCFDFANQSIAGLAGVSVDIEVITPRGERERHSVFFTPRGDPIQTLEFRIPLPPDSVNRYRVTRIVKSGEVLAGAWEEAIGRFLDVSELNLEIKESSDE